MLQQYSLFYKQNGVRKLTSLLLPTFIDLYTLPRDATYHDVAEVVYNDDVRKNPDLSDIYLKNYKKRIPVFLVENCYLPSGAYIRKNKDPAILSRGFFKDNAKVFRRIKSGEKFEDPFVPFVYNYGYLSELYVYQSGVKAEIYKHSNLWKTVWKNAKDNILETKRNQFVVLNFDSDLPGQSLLKMYEKTELPNTLVFNTDDKLMMLDLWRWVNLNTRHLSHLSEMDETLYPKLNLIVKNKTGKATLLNLGYLNSWIKGQKNQTEFSSVQQYEPSVIQKVVLKHMLLICEANTEEPISDVQENKNNSDSGDFDDYESPVENENTIHSEVLKKTNGQKVNADYEPIVEVKDGEELHLFELDKSLKDLDKDLEETDAVYKESLNKKGIGLKDGELVEIFEEEESKTREELIVDFLHSKDPSDVLKRHAEHLADEGAYTASEYKKILKDIEKANAVPDPYGRKLPVAEVRRLSIEDVSITEEKNTIQPGVEVFDKSMEKSSLIAFDQDYIEKAMKNHMVAMISSVQKAGVIITDHTVTEETSILGSRERHAVSFKPLRGSPSTVYMEFPKVNRDGHFVVSSNKYLMRKQRVDLPIRKIGPSEVALTSYYGKTFVSLSEKKADSSTDWLCRKINEKALQEDSGVSEIAPADVFYNKLESPWIYGMLSQRLRSFRVKDMWFIFDYPSRKEILMDEKQLGQIEENGQILVGIAKHGEYIRICKDGNFEIYRQKVWTPLGNIYSILDLDYTGAPVDFSVVNVFSKPIPVGVVLAYYMGFQNLLTLTQVKYRTVEARKQKNLEQHEFSVSFQDVSFIFSREDKINSTLFGGFTDFEKETKRFPMKQFNKPAVYFNLLESKKLSSIYLSELQSMKDLFVDPITDLILQSMKEPREFVGLLIRANELLQTCQHADSQDMLQMRIRGYERFVGVAYKQMVDSVRQFKSKNTAGKGKVEMSPYATWSMIMKDPANKLAEEINPIQSLKEQEIVTYVGEGGRGKESMSKKTRAYHESDIGVISEATVDSSDVGVNMYTSPNPQFKNTLGVVSEKQINSTSCWSTSALLAPGSDKDDFKRINFVNVQQSHTVACPAYHQPYVGTGYEHIIGHRTNAMFCYTAKQDGKVKSLNERGITIEYKDGSLYGIELGRVFGKAEGSVYPHDILPYVKEGQLFKKGQVISYNSGFYEPYLFDPTQVVYKGSKTVKVVLVESSETHEDGCAISAELGKEFYTKTCKIKSITVDFAQGLLDVVKVGQTLEPDQVLMIIEDEITSSGSFDEEALRSLRKFAKQAPKADYRCTVDKIEVFYNGDKADMSDSLRKLTDQSDREIVALCKATNSPIVTGQVTEEYRVKGSPLIQDKAEIKIYLTLNPVCGVGDKIVFANQMKSIIGRVMKHPIITESGDTVDAQFSYLKILGRVCQSPIIIGMQTSLLKTTAKLAVLDYES